MLTKSNFTQFLTCKNEFWLISNTTQENQTPLSISDLHRREEGYEVERLARKLEIFIEDESKKVEFGKEFQTDSLYAKADIVITDLKTDGIKIYEVKGSTKVNEVHQNDLAFQCLTAQKAGFNVEGAYLITVNNEFLFEDKIIPENFFSISDETNFVYSVLENVELNANEAIKLSQSPEPTVTLLDYCKSSKLDCAFLKKHFPDIPEYNVSHIFNSGSKKLNALLSEGILDLRDIPHDFSLTARESSFVEVERKKLPFINSEEIKNELAKLKFPLNFLDYETFNPAVPKFSKTRPYQQVVFQYSLHTLNEPDGELLHSFHLSRNDGKHPTHELAQRLSEDLDQKIGTVIVWNESFEKNINKEIALMFSEFSDFMDEVNNSMFDLRKIFSNRHYLHPEFYGKNSIKKVLPVLCPDLSYKEMDIADGLTASIKWYHLATKRGSIEEQEKIYEDLTKYCNLDTLAMVKIYEVLLSI